MRRWKTVSIVAVLFASLGGTAFAQDGPELVSVDTDEQPLATHLLDHRVSDDGNLVVFQKPSQEEINAEVFLRDRGAGTTRVVYRGMNVTGVAISGDGRYVALRDQVANINENYYSIYVVNVATGAKQSVGSHTDISAPSLTDDGRGVAFSGRRPWQESGRVVVRDLDTGQVRTVTSGPAAFPVISGDGGKVAFRQYQHVYSRTLVASKAVRVDVRPDGSFSESFYSRPVGYSDTGRFLAFTSYATDIAPNTDGCVAGSRGCLFRRNFAEAKTTVASVLADGTAVGAEAADFSGDGRVVVFSGQNMHPGIYTRVLSTATTRLSSVDDGGQPMDDLFGVPRISRDGATVVFATGAPSPTAETSVWAARGK